MRVTGAIAHGPLGADGGRQPEKDTTMTIATRGLAVLALALAPLGAWSQAGPSPAPAAVAADLFSQVCVSNRGDYDGAVDLLGQMSMNHDAESDIHYHPQYDLSFKVIAVGNGAAYCSMVWSSTDAVPANVAAIATVAPDADDPVLFTPTLMRTRLLGKE